MLPNFLIIGAAKSGTTSLYRHLARHPDVFMSPTKETNFFALEGREPRFSEEARSQRVQSGRIHRLADYVQQFDGVRGERAIGEASPWYLHSDQAPARILHHVPDAKLIAILRNPAERAYSAYRGNRRDGLEPCDTFEAALAEQERRRDEWSWGLEFIEPGFYHRHLSRYYELFPRDHLRTWLFEDLVADPGRLMANVCRFLEVDPHRLPPGLSERYNASTGGGSLLSRLGTLLPFRPVPPPERMRSDTRGRLVETYREDVLALQELIGRDLSHWLRAGAGPT